MNELLFQAVPNISEGRNLRTIDAIATAITSTGAHLADVHVDADHHRSVFTVFAPADVLTAALVVMTDVALDRIDLNGHDGVHPRVGAVDVLPIVWLDDIDPRCGGRDVAVDTALHVGTAIGARHPVPIVLYGEALDAPAYAGALRRGGIDEIAARIEAGDVLVHAGPTSPHPAAGLTLLGARPVLVAFNVVLDRDDLAPARAIAAEIRESDGGLLGVRAMAVPLASRGLVQISCNIERWREVGPREVLHAVRERAHAHGADVRECELVGLCPDAAWRDLTGEDVRVVAVDEPVIERHVRDALNA